MYINRIIKNLLKDVLFDGLVSAVVDTTDVVARSFQIDVSG